MSTRIVRSLRGALVAGVAAIVLSSPSVSAAELNQHSLSAESRKFRYLSRRSKPRPGTAEATGPGISGILHLVPPSRASELRSESLRLSVRRCCSRTSTHSQMPRHEFSPRCGFRPRMRLPSSAT